MSYPDNYGGGYLGASVAQRYLGGYPQLVQPYRQPYEAIKQARKPRVEFVGESNAGGRRGYIFREYDQMGNAHDSVMEHDPNYDHLSPRDFVGMVLQSAEERSPEQTAADLNARYGGDQFYAIDGKVKVRRSRRRN